MATTPTQMRLTDNDLVRLDRIRRILRCNTRTSVVRELIAYFEDTSGFPKRFPKKSSVRS